MDRKHYIIRGGLEGRARLVVLSRIMRPATLSVLDRAGICPGMNCLEIGCGSGDIAFELARIVGPRGKVVATDIDEIKLRLAREEAAEHGLTNLEFRCADILTEQLEKFDFVHARFLLTHLPDPRKALEQVRLALHPGGALVVEDVDFRGHFCHPENRSFSRYVELYIKTAQRRGADPNIGPRLPGLLVEAGIKAVRINLVQVVGMSDESKLMAPLTMENIADSVLTEGLASHVEIHQLVHELYEFAHDPTTIISGPRVIQTWGHRP
ncbi:MAG: class I SAM-dependent methyltransferase [Verrucomicrobia bacterium]|nr:class I SAM-dependent methyltransferase [Verrucomicrobiota bacterium]